MMAEHPLGRRLPSDDQHIQHYPLRGVLKQAPPATVEKVLPAPSTDLRRFMDQGQEGACVGFAWSWAMSFLNATVSAAGRTPVMPRYDAEWLYRQAQAIDEYADTPPAEGTSVRAGGDVLRTQGAVREIRRKDQPVNPADGIAANRWATSIDDIRLGLSLGIPVVFGLNWYENFDTPVKKGNEWWIGAGDLGRIRGGHAICAYGASDRRHAVKLQNSWGLAYPAVWVPYAVIERLLAEEGEAALITDK